MNSYFDQKIDRRNTNSYKWDVKEGELPLSIADMDFKTAPEIIDDLRKIIDKGVYGYCQPTKEWFKAYKSFYRDLHGLDIEEDELIFSTGVVPTISSSVRALTDVNDGVIVLPPVYNIFYNSIINNKRRVVEVPLLFDGTSYNIDFASLELEMAKKENRLLIFCNPGNPVSRIWSKEELERLVALARKYSVIILSDEIHGDITRPGKVYCPFFTINGAKEAGFAAISPTKCFNLAGIQTSAIVIKDEKIRTKVVRQLNTDECAEPNVLAIQAAISAFTKGREFLKSLNSYLFENRDFLEKYIKENIPELEVIHGDATYLVWVNIEKTKFLSDEFVEELRKETGLIIASGAHYGKTGEKFIRIAVAVSRDVLIDGLNRLKKFCELIRTH